jgi:hypothetical protein
MNEDTWPAFVIEELNEARSRGKSTELTGWETVTFELDDADIEEWDRQNTGFSYLCSKFQL